MSKRILALLLAVLFGLSCLMLTACKDTKTTEGTKATTGEKTTDPKTTSEDTTEPNSETSSGTPSGSPSGEPVKGPWADTTEMYVTPYSSQWEYWNGTTIFRYQLCLTWNMAECDSTPGIGTEDCEFTFKVYYRPSSDESADYKVIDCPINSCYIFDATSTESDVIYRLETYLGGWKDYVVDTEYEVCVEVLKAGTPIAHGITYLTYDQGDADDLQAFKDYWTSQGQTV